MRKSFYRAALAPLLLLGSVSTTQAANWVIDPEGSEVVFSYTYSGTPYSGKFVNIDATFEIDPTSPADCQIDVTIPIEDMAIDDEETKSYLLDIELFDVGRFPTATFTADSCEMESMNEFVADGQLTIRDQTHPLRFPFTLNIEGDRFNLTSEVTIQRLDYGVGQGYFANTSAIPNEIDVAVDVYAEMQ